MSRPPFEVADIVRITGDSFRQRYSASLTWPQRKVLDAIVRCRTAALGGHRIDAPRTGRLDPDDAAAPQDRHGSDDLYRVDLRPPASSCGEGKGRASADAESDRSGQEEERQDRCRQDRRLPAMRLPAGVPYGFDGDP